MRIVVKMATKVSNLVYSIIKRATIRAAVRINSLRHILRMCRRNASIPVAKNGDHVGNTYQELIDEGSIWVEKQSKTKMANERRRTKLQLETSNE